MSDLTAKEALTEWWAELEPKIQPRPHAKQGLVFQVQREALAKAQAISGRGKLSAEDTEALIAFALETCVLGPRFDG